MRERVWIGNAVGQVGVWNHALNWAKVNIRNADYRWLASGSGTDEYYLDLTAGGDPGVPAAPEDVQEDGTDMTPGSAGTLAVGEWAFADNDSLGYSTIYVRLTDGADPDSKAFGFLTYTAVPGAGEDVTIPAGSEAIDAFDNTATTLAFVRFEAGHQGAVADENDYLRLKCTGFYFEGEGQAYIDLADSAIAPEIVNTANANEGYRGLYLLGTALTTLRVQGGTLGLASRAAEAARVNAVEVIPLNGEQASLWIGDQVTDVAASGHPDITVAAGGEVIARCEVDTVTQLGGTYIQQESIWASAIAHAGILRPEGTGTYAATELAGGTLDATTDSRTKTFTDTTVRKGSTVKDSNSRITYTNAIEFPDGIAAGVVTLDFGRSRKFTPVAI